jgi:hypothetical protein
MLSAHVLSLETPFASQQMGKLSRYSDSDWFTYCIDIWLLTYCHIDDCCFSVSNISVSHALEMTIHFYHPTHELFSFSFTQPFTHSKFCSPYPFLFGATPAINNDRSLRQVKNKKCTLGNIAAQWVNYRHWQIFWLTH